MAKIHIQYKKGYTVISNYMFTNDTLSLKAIGLFCYMVSRPEGWRFSERGLASQLKDGKASVASALKELREKKYLKMEPNQKNELGRMIGSSYFLYQIPYDIDRSTLAEAVFTGDKGRGELKVEKITNFTILSNYHLLDGLSLKAMGLLSFLLNLPDNWDTYSVDYLKTRFSDGRTVISSALKELQEHHYIKTEQKRNEKGFLGKNEYYIYEYPYDLDPITDIEFKEKEINDTVSEEICTDSCPPCPENLQTDNRAAENPLTDKQSAENQVTENRVAENRPHINIKQNNNKKINIKKANMNSSSSSIAESGTEGNRDKVKMMIKEKIGFESIVSMNNELEEQMDNEEITLEFFNRCYVNPRYLNSIINAMTDVYCSTETEIKTGLNKTCSRYRIIENFEALNLVDIKNIIHKIIDIKPNNVRGFALTVINNYL